MDDRFTQDRYHIKQLIRPMVNLYEVRAMPAGTDQPGELVAFVRQKRMALKEDLRAYADDSESEEVFRIKARSMIDVSARNDVTDPQGVRIGSLTKAFGSSLLRSTWRVLGPDEAELFTAQESSASVAIGRRVANLVPYLDLLPIPYHFSFTHDGTEVGGLRRIYGVRDHYELSLAGDPGRTIDRRLAIALAIALDALQAR